MTISIDVRDIVKKFGDFTAVDGISFAVDDGETFGLLGPNGAGKSTLIRMLTTLLLPTSGTAIVAGQDIVKDADRVRRAIGVIPQALTSDLDLTAEENLLIFAKLYGVPRERRKALIADLLAAVELSQWADKPVKNLSGGMRRRVEIARGLVHEPRILFLDEPTTGLDPVSRTAVWEMLRAIKADRRLTVLLTTHYMDEADKLCDRIAIVDHGSLKALDSPHEAQGRDPRREHARGELRRRAGRLGGAPGGAAGGGAPWKANRRCSASCPPADRRRPTRSWRWRRAAGVTVTSLSVQSTSLDDVFVHYTGHQLRDALQEPAPTDSRFMMRR